MKTVSAVNVTYAHDDIGHEVGLHRSVREYQTELENTAAGLASVTGYDAAVCRSMAYLIVHETIPETLTRTAFETVTRPQALDLGGTTMRMLDGNLSPPTSYGAGGEANPAPSLPLEYWLEEQYNNE